MEIIRNNGNGLMDVQTASEYLGIKKSTLYQMCMRRQIPVVKIGRLNRFKRADLDKFIEKSTVSPNETEIAYQ